ncbi:MAG: polysaccharide deacetylase family protein [Propionibacteriaceae bacterium]|nr:polysaccharide deacetylase family protein [Propionibacteriaceae bacterium]
MSTHIPVSRRLQGAVVGLVAAGLLGAGGCAQVPPQGYGRPSAVPTATVAPFADTDAVPAGGVPSSSPTFAPPSISAATLPGALPVPSVTTTPAATSTVAKPKAAPNCAKQKCLAVTFDDGPMPETEKLLTLLKKQHVHATFFVLGEQAKAHPGVLRRMAADGHVIGNHSFSHPQFWKLSAAGIKSQLSRTSTTIHKAAGTKVTLFRPPYGESNATIRKVAGKLGLSQILWSVDPLDWRYRNATEVAKRIMKLARPGAIVLSHDIYPTTRKAWAIAIPKLRKQGYVFVTVPQLLGSRLKPGRSYSQR